MKTIMDHLLFEVTAAGFDGGTDETDDRVYWVYADTPEQVQEAIRGTGAKLWGELPKNLCGSEQNHPDVDFTLPLQASDLRSTLLGWAQT